MIKNQNSHDAYQDENSNYLTDDTERYIKEFGFKEFEMIKRKVDLINKGVEEFVMD
jgi:hypothetical protein